MAATLPCEIRSILQAGCAIPATPLALDAKLTLDERRQRALYRYYSDAGAGGLAVGVHVTQFQIHRAEHALLEPLWRLAAEEMNRLDAGRDRPLVRVAGICGRTGEAAAEAELAAALGYHLGLVNLAALTGDSAEAMVEHCRVLGQSLPVMGFYLQPAMGGPVLDGAFWRKLAELESLAAIKLAVFDRYRTLETVRAIVEADRDDVALYTGNDDAIVADLLTPYRLKRGHEWVTRRIVGGLLGHWAVWTRPAVALFERCRQVALSREPVPTELLELAGQVTDMNDAVFDPTHDYAGTIPGIHEVLRRQGLLKGLHFLDPTMRLSEGQAERLDRVIAAYPHLTDDPFVLENLDRWMSG